MFVSQKGELLRSFLEERGVYIPQGFGGWRKVSCFNDAAHPRGDHNPSASVNLGTGRYKCFACDLAGDVYDLLLQLDGLDFKAAQAKLGHKQGDLPKEPTWI